MLDFLLADNTKDIKKILDSLKFPLFGSPKLDGIRGSTCEKGVYSRNQLLFPNVHLQERFGWHKYLNYDGEFIVGEPNAKDVFSRTQSVTRSKDKPIDELSWWVFDYKDETLPYYRRIEKLVLDSNVLYVPQLEMRCLDDVLEYEESQVDQGFEGLILRDPMGRYKMGRSTLREGILLKLKRFVDDEAVVIGFEERMHNGNEKTLEKHGKAVRNGQLAGLVPLDTLGAIRVRWNDIEFNIGSGFDSALAKQVWNHQDEYLGKSVTFKYFPKGMKDAPRHPVFKSFREGKE